MAELSTKVKPVNRQIIVGGLGRPFTLGMLYNAPKDHLVPGAALWDSETLKSLTVSRPQRSSHFDVSASDSTKDSSFDLNVDASLKLSFMSGMIEVGGSANYLNNKKEFKNQSSVTLQYQATTHFEQLCLTAEACKKIQSSKIIEEGMATHLVTGIEFGANAFFVFNSQKVQANELQKVTGQMEVTIKKIPTAEIHGAAKVDLTEEEKKLVKTFSVRFFGDFLLESNPATFDAAVQTYVDLPKLLIGDEGNKPVNTVPVRVWLLPLEVFNLHSGLMTKGISVGLVIEAENVLEELSNIKMRCNDCLSATAVGLFPPLQHQLHMFHKLCHYYSVELQRQMAETCPAIREGKKPENALRHLFEERKTSPFSQDRLSQWLQGKEREINVVQFCLDIMKGINVMSTESMVDSFVMSPLRPVCNGFIFTALGEDDGQINDMEKYIDSMTGVQRKRQDRTGSQNDTPWFLDNDIIKAMRTMAYSFASKKDLAHRFVAAIADPKQPGSVLYTYQGGLLYSKPKSETMSPVYPEELPPNTDPSLLF